MSMSEIQYGKSIFNFEKGTSDQFLIISLDDKTSYLAFEKVIYCLKTFGDIFSKIFICKGYTLYASNGYKSIFGCTCLEKDLV